MGLSNVYAVKGDSVPTANEGEASSKTIEQPNLPVVNVAGFLEGGEATKARITAELDFAFTEFGFAVVLGHGVSDATFDRVYDVGKAFFQRNPSEKGMFDRKQGYGYGGYLASQEAGGQLTGQIAKKSDGVESLTVRGLQHLCTSSVASNEIDVTLQDLHFAQDMSEVTNADPIPEPFLEPLQNLHKELFDFKLILNEVTERSLGVSRNAFAKIFDPTRGGIRFAYYPEMEAATFVGKPIGYGAHADSGGMVVLRLDKENPVGTEVYYKEEWIPVPNIPGAIILNLGTVLSLLTGGRWRAAIHRAARANAKERLSLVCGAMVPNNDLELKHLGTIIHAGDTLNDSKSEEQDGQPQAKKAKTRTVCVKEYLDARVRMQRPGIDPTAKDLVKYVDSLEWRT